MSSGAVNSSASASASASTAASATTAASASPARRVNARAEIPEAGFVGHCARGARAFGGS